MWGKKEKSFKNGDIEGFSSLVFVFLFFCCFFSPCFGFLNHNSHDI